MQLEKPVSITFELVYTTERAFMAKNIRINDQMFVAQTSSLPKMYTELLGVDDDNIATANCEYWILEQRKIESTNNVTSNFAEELLAM